MIGKKNGGIEGMKLRKKKGGGKCKKKLGNVWGEIKWIEGRGTAIPYGSFYSRATPPVYPPLVDGHGSDYSFVGSFGSFASTCSTVTDSTPVASMP